MKPVFGAPMRRAVLISAGMILALADHGHGWASDPASPVVHAPIRVQRNDDGSVKRGPRNEIATSNWSGYAIAKFQTGQTYTTASGAWTVPSVSFDTSDTSGSTTQYSSTWVGIGGYCQNSLCTRADRTLIQLGTEQDVSLNGTTSYYSWYELIPKYPVVMPTNQYLVTPGDFISVSMVCNQPCPSKNQSWTLTMWDYPSQPSNGSPPPNWHWSVDVTYTSSKLSTEWIEEAPSSSGGILPLANFGTAHIFPQPNTVIPSLKLGTNGIEMLDPWGESANSSSPGSASFNDCWFSTSPPGAC